MEKCRKRIKKIKKPKGKEKMIKQNYFKINRSDYNFYNGDSEKLGYLKRFKKEWVWVQEEYIILDINSLLEIVLKINRLNKQKIK